MEIERKWLIKILPDLTGLTPISYERHFLYIGDVVEIRIQRKGDKYQFERKSQVGKLSREEQVFDVTEEEFDSLKKHSVKAILRESYLIQNNPQITIKVYKGEYQGLIRAEVEFESEVDAERFAPLDWFGREITETPLGRDKLLINLSKEEFEKLISEFKKI